MSRQWTRLAAMLFVITSCGGEVRRSETVDTDASTTTNPSGGSSGTFPGTIVSLPDCRPGFDPNLEPMKDCNFVVAGLCYDTKLDACACACPRNRSDTNCTSGSPETDGHVVVICD